MDTGLHNFGAPANWVVAVILGEGQIEMQKVSLGGLEVEIYSEHTVGEVQFNVTREVAIQVPEWAEVESHGF